DCTNDQCNGSVDVCQHPAKADGVVCTDDGNVCTTDTCATGTCTHTPGNAGAVCRAASGQPCDVADLCTGASAACPADGFAGGTTTCRPPSCAAGVETLTAVCDGTVPTCPPIVTQPCGNYVCGATACLTGCTTDNDCTAGNYCAAGACVPKQ